MSSAIPSPARTRGKVAPSRMAHFVLRTTPERFQAVVSWYKTVLEAEPAFENPFACFMTYDEEHHRIAVIAVPGLGERVNDTIGVDHVAFTYAGLADLVATFERLKTLGISPETVIHHGPTMSLYYLDPDRNQIELQIDVFEGAAEFLESEHFAKNPIGTLFDMDDLCRRYHAGEPIETLTRPIEGPIPGAETFGEH